MCEVVAHSGEATESHYFCNMCGHQQAAVFSEKSLKTEYGIIPDTVEHLEAKEAGIFLIKLVECKTELNGLRVNIGLIIKWTQT